MKDNDVRIIYTGDGAEKWTTDAEKLVEYVKGHFFLLGILPFSLNNNAEVMISVFRKSVQVDILSGVLIAKELDIKRCIAVGTSLDDYRVYLVDDKIGYKEALFDFYMPGQIVGDQFDEDRQRSIIAPRISEETLRSAIESDNLSEDREYFGKILSYYHDMVCHHMHRKGLLRRNERIIAAGIIGE